MDTLQSFPFKIGQDAESKSHTDGYRGAWFRCKVKNISMRGGELWCALEYFDFPGEKVRWTKVYQKDPVNRKKLELMMRPGFPHFCRECDITDCQNNSQMEAIINNDWQVGNLVDLWYDCCFWSGKITAILDNNKIQVDLLKPPNGEGGSYEVDCKDLRPTLLWSIKSGWIVPLQKNIKYFKPCVRVKGDCKPTLHMNTPAQGKNYPWKSLVLQDSGSVANMDPELMSDQEKDMKIFHSHPDYEKQVMDPELMSDQEKDMKIFPSHPDYEKQVMDTVMAKEISYGVDHPPGTCRNLTEWVHLLNEIDSSKHFMKDGQPNLKVGRAECGSAVTGKSEGFPKNVLCQSWQVRANELQEVDTSHLYNGPVAHNQDWHMTGVDRDGTGHHRKVISVENSLPGMARTDRNQYMMNDSLSGKGRNPFALSTYKKEQARVIVDRAKSFCHGRGRLKCKSPAVENNCLFSVGNQFDMPFNSRNKKSKSSSCRDVDEIESSVIVLEELANKVRWLKGVMQFGFKQGSVMTGLAWQFAENQMPDKEVSDS